MTISTQPSFAAEQTVKDPDAISKKLIENIHELININTALIIGVILTILYAAIFIDICRNKNKIHI